MPHKRPDIRLVDPPRSEPKARPAATWAERVRAAQQGDQSAFAELVREHQGAVYAFAVAQMGDATDAWDAAQETLVKAYRRLETYRFAAPFRTWLLQITRNTCMDRLRQRHSQAEGLRRYGVHRDLDDPPVDPERTLRAVQATERIHSALAELEPIFREVIVLFDLQGHSYQEIAGICGIPIGTVRSRLGRGREALRRILLSQGALSGEGEPASRTGRDEEAP